MAETTDLSPWVHPKAQAWFAALFRRTHLPMALEDELKRPEEHLPVEVVRMILAFAVMLGRPEIWPEKERDVLTQIVEQAKAYSQKPPRSATGAALTLADHQSFKKTAAALKQELEIVRRRMGTSARKGKVDPPQSWQPFWE